MTSIQERLQLKRVPLDTWNIREQLCLASAVVRSGDQNWMSVSRSLKTICDPNRPADWYSQKSCAAQYGALLENVETPKRKKRNSEGAVETPQESIHKKLTQERIAEIQNTLGELNHQHTVIKNEVAELRDPQTSEERVKEIWAGIEASKRTREKEQAKRAAWLKEREERRARAERSWRPTPPVSTSSIVTSSPVVPAPQPSSPLLSSLLKSSPVVTTPQHISHPANVIETISPSAGAPTLSMLLDKRSSTHETEHAAIEHIKSEIVQLERQLKVAASNSPPPSVPITTAVAIPTTVPHTGDKIDIDDIEINAEDVYAFSDIDLQIPPVSSIHKPSIIREEPKISLEDDSKKDEDVDVDTIPSEELSLPPPIIIPNQDEAKPEEPIEESENDDEGDLELPEENNVTIPEVKFPTAEIKVIAAEQAKESVKSTPEVSEAPTPKEDEIEVNVTDDDDSILPQDADTTSASQTSSEEVQQSTAEVNAQSLLEETPGAPETVTDHEVPESQSSSQDQISEDQNSIESEGKPNEEVNEPPPSTETESQETETEDSQTPEPERDDTNDVEQKENIETTKSIEAEIPKETEIPIETEMPIETQVPIQAEKSIEINKPEDKSEESDVQDVEVKEAEIEEKESAKEAVKEEKLVEETKVESSEDSKTPPVLEEVKLEEIHTETDDDVPMELIREEEKDGKKRRDYSRKRKYESRSSESAPESPASSEDRQHKLWKKAVMGVHSRLCAHKCASLFLRPITNDQAPNYDKIVRKPMDLTTIKKNIDAGVIRTTSEFRRSVLLMLSNALFYNSITHDVHKMTKEMHKEADAQFGMLLHAQAHAELPPAPRHHKRRSHTHAAKRPRIE